MNHTSRRVESQWDSGSEGIKGKTETKKNNRRRRRRDYSQIQRQTEREKEAFFLTPPLLPQKKKAFQTSENDRGVDPQFI